MQCQPKPCHSLAPDGSIPSQACSNFLKELDFPVSLSLFMGSTFYALKLVFCFASLTDLFVLPIFLSVQLTINV